MFIGKAVRVPGVDRYDNKKSLPSGLKLSLRVLCVGRLDLFEYQFPDFPFSFYDFLFISAAELTLIDLCVLRRS